MKKLTTIGLFLILSFNYFSQFTTITVFGNSTMGGDLNINGKIYSNADIRMLNGGEFRIYKNGVHGIKMGYINTSTLNNSFFDFRNKMYFRNLLNGNVSPLLLQSDGSVVINSQTNYGSSLLYNTQGFKLAVNGGILCEEIKVIANVPSFDIVFEPDYKLMSLQDLESYVNKNKHLPDIPSAKEFKRDGYSLNEMDGLLLKKTEELTLYMIEMNKQMAEMKKNLNTLKKENEELRGLLTK